jgi:hypothetical protein
MSKAGQTRTSSHCKNRCRIRRRIGVSFLGTRTVVDANQATFSHFFLAIKNDRICSGRTFAPRKVCGMLTLGRISARQASALAAVPGEASPGNIALRAAAPPTGSIQQCER